MKTRFDFVIVNTTKSNLKYDDIIKTIQSRDKIAQRLTCFDAPGLTGAAYENMGRIFGGTREQHIEWLNQANSIVNEQLKYLQDYANQAEETVAQNLIISQRNRAKTDSYKIENLLLQQRIKDQEFGLREIEAKVNETKCQQVLLEHELESLNVTKLSFLYNITPSQKSFLLQTAIITGKEDIIDLIISSDYNPNFQRGDKEGLVHTAIRLDKKHLVQKIVAKRVNLTLNDKDGKTPLYLAIELRKTDLMDLLYSNDTVSETLLSAIKLDNKFIIESIFKHYPNLANRKNIENKTLLSTALEKNQSELANLFLTKGGDLEEAIASNQSLESINLKGSRGKPEDIVVLVKLINDNNSINTLDLSDSQLSINGEKELIRGLEDNFSITQLNLSNNNLSSASNSGLCNFVRFNASLQYLDLSNNQFNRQFGVDLAYALAGNNSITYLNLSKIATDQEAILALAEFLEDNTSLKYFHFSDNNVGPQLVKPLIDSLKHSRSIKISNLSNNNLQESGAILVSELLTNNKFLSDLDLSGNNFGDVGAIFIANTLRMNIALLKIDLSHNNISIVGLRALAETIEVNFSLIDINLSSNNFTKESAIGFASFSLNNLSILKLTGSGELLVEMSEKLSNNKILFAKNLSQLKSDTFVNHDNTSFIKQIYILFKQLQYMSENYNHNELSGNEAQIYTSKLSNQLQNYLENSQQTIFNPVEIELIAQLQQEISGI